MSTPSKDTREELPPIKDKIQQIFKFLEIVDVSQWQGMNVFEAGDADTLYGILETAFEQVAKEERERCKEVLKDVTDDFDGAYQKFPAKEAAIIIKNRILSALDTQ